MNYRIGWIDDQLWDVISVDKQYKDLFQKTFNDSGLEVVLFATDWDSFNKQKGEANRLDAVIFDMNFAKTGNPKDDNDKSGLTYCLSWIDEQKNSSRPILCYLYSGRDEEQIKDFLKDYPESFSQDNVFRKELGKLAMMAKKIKKDLDDDNSSEKRIRRRFYREIELAREVSPECEKYLQSILLAAFNENGIEQLEIEKTIGFFRDIFEKCILVKCKEEKILPPLDALGEASTLAFSKEVICKNGCKYRIKEDSILMDTATSYLYGKVLNIMVNDAMHVKDGLRMEIRKHIQQTSDINIYRGMLFMTLSILQWYHDNREQLSNNPIWYEVESEDSDYLDGADLIVTVKFVNEKFVFSKNIKIKRNYSYSYRIGMKLRIKQKDENTGYDKEKYPYYVDCFKHTIEEE